MTQLEIVIGSYIDPIKELKWEKDQIFEALARARKAQSRVIAQGALVGLQDQANFLTEEALTTSAIEGEKLDRNTVRSSVARRLGLSTAGLPITERRVEGLVEMLLDATTNYQAPLTQQRLWGWQAALFPTGYSGTIKIAVGAWRSGHEPMRVVSGSMEREKIHFEAPPSETLKEEMKLFLNWWQKPPAGLDGLIRAAIAHLWFVTIHPFDDGNGRVARAITEMALAQDEAHGRRLYSLSMQIVRDRDLYYAILERTQKGSIDITVWIVWFLDLYARAVLKSEETIQKAILVANFWQKRNPIELNSRQLKVLQRLLEAEPSGFEGGLTNRKYVALTRTSRETAKRDLADLEKKGLLKRNSGQGRSVSYSLILEN